MPTRNCPSDVYAIRTLAETKTDLSLNLVENTALSSWAGTASITTLGTIVTGTWQGTTVAINQGGTGQTTAQAAIDSLSAVSGATNEYVLTKDTATSNAKWKVAAGGGANHAILDGSVHTDSVADGVTRGSLIYGNATPKWDELVVGVADTFLGSDGTDLSYRTAAQTMASLSGAGSAAFDLNGQDLTNGGVLFLTEQAAAEADVPGKGQFWVKDTTPNEAWFTDDEGTDQKLSNTKTVLLSSTSKFLSATTMNIAGNGFVAKINGAPTATSVVYDTDTNENSLVWLAYASPSKIANLVLHNLTRSNSRIATNINVSTNTITTENTSDDWATNDDITAVSQTAIWAISNWYDLDCSDYLPANAIGIILDVGFFDSANASGQAFFHSYETYANQKIIAILNPVANVTMSKFITVPINSQKMCFSVLTNAGGDTGRLSINVAGYITEN